MLLTWQDDDIRAAYVEWLGAWVAALPPPRRVLFETLAFGAAVGPARRERTACVPSAEGAAIFLPEMRLLWLPAAGSRDEFATRMLASIDFE